ncbi:MAG: hypothetical protein ACOX87_15500 [Chloroflexota bacterium]|jgi:hypothetical protein
MKRLKGLDLLVVGAAVTLLGVVAMFAGGGEVRAEASGQGNCGGWAIWTTDKDGNAVNENQYDSKEDVYINGGPNNKKSNKVPAGDYWYLVTDPSGTSLYSDTGPRHLVVEDSGDGTGDFPLVQLAPFGDTPNPGGEYKVTVARDEGMRECPKSDNFKVRESTPTPTATVITDETPTPTATVPTEETATPTATVPTEETATPTATVPTEETPTPTATVPTDETATPTATATATPTQTDNGGGDNGGGDNGGDDNGGGSSPTSTPVPTETPATLSDIPAPAAQAEVAGAEPPAVPTAEPPAESPEPIVEVEAAPPPEPMAQAVPVLAKPDRLPSSGEASSSSLAVWMLGCGVFLMMSGLLMRFRETR